MFSLTHNFLKVASVAAVVALSALGTPASANEMVQNLGPVPAHAPIPCDSLSRVGRSERPCRAAPASPHFGPTLVTGIDERVDALRSACFNAHTRPRTKQLQEERRG